MHADELDNYSVVNNAVYGWYLQHGAARPCCADAMEVPCLSPHLMLRCANSLPGLFLASTLGMQPGTSTWHTWALVRTKSRAGGTRLRCRS